MEYAIFTDSLLEEENTYFNPELPPVFDSYKEEENQLESKPICVEGHGEEFEGYEPEFDVGCSLITEKRKRDLDAHVLLCMCAVHTSLMNDETVSCDVDIVSGTVLETVPRIISHDVHGVLLNPMNLLLNYLTIFNGEVMLGAYKKEQEDGFYIIPCSEFQNMLFYYVPYSDFERDSKRGKEEQLLTKHLEFRAKSVEYTRGSLRAELGIILIPRHFVIIFDPGGEQLRLWFLGMHQLSRVYLFQ